MMKGMVHRVIEKRCAKMRRGTQGFHLTFLPGPPKPPKLA